MPEADPLPAVVAFSTVRWGWMYDAVAPRLIGLARRGWRVYHSNGAFYSWDRDTAEWAEAGWHARFERRDGVMVERRGRSPFRWPVWPLWDRLALKSVARRIRRARRNSTSARGGRIRARPTARNS